MRSQGRQLLNRPLVGHVPDDFGSVVDRMQLCAVVERDRAVHVRTAPRSPIDEPVFEVIASLRCGAELVAGWVAKGATFPVVLFPRSPDGAMDLAGSGGRGPVDGCGRTPGDLHRPEVVEAAPAVRT